MSNSKLSTAAANLEQKYAKPGSGIVSVGTKDNSIKVVVNSLAAAGKLPAKFEGYDVVVYQDLGPAGEKLIVCDANGNVIGAQG